jgi:plasmid stabilization system protein ParE
MKPLRIAALAEDELREARDWYDAKNPGLGQRFVRAMGDLLEAIRESPHRYPVVYSDIRQALPRKYPYAVFFRERPDLVEIIGVVHLHRHPDTWKRRG